MTAFTSMLEALRGRAPDSPSGEFDVEAAAEDGTRRWVPLASAARIPLADMTPARRIKARKGQRNLPGCWWSATDGRHVGYEWWLERDQVMWLDWDQTVTGIASQPFRLWWTAQEGKTSSHVPDYFAERAEARPCWSTAGPRTAVLPGTWPRSRQLAGHAPWPGGSTGWPAPWTRLPRRTCGGWPGTGTRGTAYRRWPGRCGPCSPLLRRWWTGRRLRVTGSPCCRCSTTCCGGRSWRPACRWGAGLARAGHRSHLQASRLWPGLGGDLVRLLPGPGTWERCAAGTGRWSCASGPLDCISRCPGLPPLWLRTSDRGDGNA